MPFARGRSFRNLVLAFVHDASVNTAGRLSRDEQIFVTPVKYERKTLMRNTEQARGVRDAAVRGIEREFD